MADSRDVLEDKSREDATAEVLSSIDFRRLKKLAELDGDFKAVLKLGEACKRSLAASLDEEVRRSHPLGCDRVHLKKLMESKSRASKLLPSKSKIETEGKLFYIIMWAVDSDGKTYYVRSGTFNEDADMSAFLGKDTFEAEIAWTLLFELNSVLRH